MLRFEKMTVKAQEAVQSAQETAARHENQQVEPVHLLRALAAQIDGVVRKHKSAVPNLLRRIALAVKRAPQGIGE